MPTRLCLQKNADEAEYAEEADYAEEAGHAETADNATMADTAIFAETAELLHQQLLLVQLHGSILPRCHLVLPMESIMSALAERHILPARESI